MNKRTQGFTLIEMLVVIGLLAVMATFSAQTYLNQYDERIAENHAMEMMTIANAAVSYAYDHNFRWLNESDGAEGCEGLVTGMEALSYFDAIFEYVPSCPVEASFTPVLQIKATLENEDMAKMVASYLPASKREGTDVTMFVLKPRGGGGTSFGVVSASDVFTVPGIGTKWGAELLKPECGAGLQLFVRPLDICAGSNTGMSAYSVETVDSDDGQFWLIYLQVTHGLLNDVDNIRSCAGDDVRFQYTITCGG